mgnify:FL=1
MPTKKKPQDPSFFFFPNLNIPGPATAMLIEKAIQNQDLELGPKLLLVSIICKSGRKGICWHKNRTLAKQLKTTTRSIQRWLAELTDKNLILQIHTNQDHPKGRRYLSPHTKQLDEIYSQLEQGGVTPVSPRGTTPLSLPTPPLLLKDYLDINNL